MLAIDDVCMRTRNMLLRLTLGKSVLIIRWPC